MFKRYILAGLTIGCSTVATFWPSLGFSFGEKRVVPDTNYYFDNVYFDRFPYAEVVGVVDGTHIIAQVGQEPRLRLIRLAGIQAPSQSPYDQEAVSMLKERLLYKTVKLEGDDFMRNIEAVGPTEAYVWTEGWQMNAEMIRAGLASIPGYPGNIKYDNLFSGLQAQAKAEKKGIWALP